MPRAACDKARGGHIKVNAYCSFTWCYPVSLMVGLTSKNYTILFLVNVWSRHAGRTFGRLRAYRSMSRDLSTPPSLVAPARVPSGPTNRVTGSSLSLRSVNATQPISSPKSKQHCASPPSVCKRAPRCTGERLSSVALLLRGHARRCYNHAGECYSPWR